ncbi:MAG: hypothetical protein ACI97K_002834 [Glaciecola sp.]
MKQDPSFFEQTDKMQAHLDSFIVNGSDQELFIASYLHGHFDVAVANVEKRIEQPEREEQPEQSSKAILYKTLENQLNQAFANNELSAEDSDQVTRLFTSLFQL